MKKLILLNICSLILINVAHSAFPYNYNIINTSDTIKKETIEEYHERIQKMGFEDYSNNTRDKDKKDNKKITTRNILIFAGTLMLLAITLLSKILYNAYTCVDTNDNCGNAEEIDNRLFWINLLAATSIGILLVTWLNKIKRRN